MTPNGVITVASRVKTPYGSSSCPSVVWIVTPA
jgi:hypothetical protein